MSRDECHVRTESFTAALQPGPQNGRPLVAKRQRWLWLKPGFPPEPGVLPAPLLGQLALSQPIGQLPSTCRTILWALGQTGEHDSVELGRNVEETVQ